MQWLSNLFERVSSFRWRDISGVNPSQPLWWSPPTAAGIEITEHTAVNLSTVSAALTVIAGTVASLPLPVYQRLATGGKRRAAEHPLYYLVHDEPNPESSALQFRESLLVHVLLHGNGYAEIVRDGAGRPIELWLLNPGQVTPFYNKRGDLRYEVISNGKPKTLWPEDIIHVAGLGFDGVRGYGVIARARESLALTAATERFGASFFGNSAKPSGVFTHPGKLKPDAIAKYRENIEKQHQGVDKVGNFIITTEGTTYTPFTIPPEEAQYLGTREFQISEVARWFSVHPYFLGDMSHSTFSNGEQAMLHFTMHTIRPLCVRIESEFNRKLVMPGERSEYFCEHLIDGLLRGDMITRYTAYAIGRNNGWMSANDILRKENENPIAGGDVYLQPLNMASAAPVPPQPSVTQPANPPNDTSTGLLQQQASLYSFPQRNAGFAENAGHQVRTNWDIDQVAPAALEAVQGTVRDAYGRMNRREATALRRAIKKPNLAEWADEFYPQHRSLLIESLAPSVRAYLAVTGSASTPEQVTEQLAERITRERRAWLTDALAANPEIGQGLETMFEKAASDLEVSTDDILMMLKHIAEHPESLPTSPTK
ncbi:phage portal protein [Anatilimnocola floriformis]|uniref:phage portal protein n=1 Tax=Anatilimnocola floriformis TaxID=2948575 RepID=UPI0020C23E76|nr:phage portal protein [Anatilimnocola floriformis]